MQYKFHTRLMVLLCALDVSGRAASAQQAVSLPMKAAESCAPGISAAERQFALPPKLLQSIGIIESGRPDPVNRRVSPWPWTINVGGIGRFFDTKASAIEAVEDLQKAGTRSVDVGCMQINLVQHPDAFASLDEAFDPPSNTKYGARFLSALYHEIGSWPQAAAAYHSRTQDLGVSYETRVMAIWPLASRFPDATLAMRSRATAAGPDLSGYTPEFIAEIKRMRAAFARLSTVSAPIGRPQHPGYSGYTTAFAAEVRDMSRTAAGRATVVSLKAPLRPRLNEAATAGWKPPHRIALPVRIAAGH